MTNGAIISLAILKVNSDYLGKDHIENFVPFVIECIRSLGTEVVSVRDVQVRMEEDFGFIVPQNALSVILNRAAKRGYIRREHSAYYPNTKALEKRDFDRVQHQVLRDHEATIGNLIDFAARHSVVWDNEKAETALHTYLSRYKVDVLRSSITGVAPADTGMRQGVDEFLVNAYLRYLCENDPTGLAYICTLVQGTMLADTLLFADISQVDRRFRDTAVYCDTRFLLRALGLHGPLEKEPCKELLDLLYKEGADAKCFDHTIDEIKNILYACMMTLASGQIGSGPVFLYMQDQGITPSDIELLIVKLDSLLKNLRIQIAEKPEYTEELQIDEKELEQSLEANIGYGEERAKARIRDVDSLSAIYRLRRGKVYDNMEQCKAIFLTCNYKLARIAKQFFGKVAAPPHALAPIAITDSSLTTLLWLKRPAAVRDLPRKLIIADCYAAIIPPEKIWNTYLAEIDKLGQQGDISPDDVYLLRCSQAARAELMDMTLGDDRAFVEGTVPQILERVKSSIKAEVLAEAHRIKAEAEAKVQKERKLREGAERELQTMRVQQYAQQFARNGKRQAVANSISCWVSRGILVAVLLFLCVGAWAAFPQYGLVSLPNIPGGLLVALVIIFFLITVVNLVTGVTVKACMRHIEVKLARWLEQKLRSLF